MDSRFIDKTKPRKHRYVLLITLILLFISIVIIKRIDLHTLPSENSSEYLTTIPENETLSEIDDMSSYIISSAELKYSIESIEIKGNTATITGWLINPNDLDSIGNVYIYVNDSYYPCQSAMREDVSNYYDNKGFLYAGFSCSIDITQWKGAEYTLTLCLLNKKTETMYQILIPESFRLN